MKTFRSLTALPLLAHAGLAAATLVAFQFSKTALDASYAASRHPVDYVTGQTGFDATAIKGYYRAMIDTQTLDIYVRTQLIDFGFLISMACIGVFVCTLIARLARPDSYGRTVGLWAGLSFLVGATCDAIENLWSFIMLANPTGFADWLALPYSGFAVAKFAFIPLGMALVCVTLGLVVVGRLTGRPKIA